MAVKKIYSKYNGLILFGVILIIYLFNLYPEVTNGDSGELLSASYTLGIAHPSGYPLYLLLLKIFIYLFPFNPAYCGNIMSAFFGAGSVYFLSKNFVILSKLLLDKKRISLNLNLLADSIALLTGITPIFLSQAIITEVYTLNIFLMLLTNFIFFKLLLSKQIKYFYLFSFLYGVALTNHPTPILLLPLYIIIIYIYFKKLRKEIFIALCLFGLGLFIYLYLLIRASANPIVNWGDPSNLSSFFKHIMRAEYKDSTLVKSRDFLFFLKQIWVFVRILWQQYWGFILLAITGLYAGLKKRYRETLILLLFFIILSIGFIYISNPRIEEHYIYVSRVFYIPSIVLISFFIFITFLWLSNRLRIVSMLILLPLIILFYFVRVESQNRNYISYDFSRNCLKTVGYKDAFFTVEGDNPLFALAYLRYVEYLRPDIDYCNRYGKLFQASSEYLASMSSVTDKGLYFTSPENLEPKYKKLFEQIGITYYLKFAEKKRYQFLNYYYLRASKKVIDYMDKGLASIYYYRLSFFYKNFLNDENEYNKNLLLTEKYGNELKDIQNMLGRLYYSKKNFKKAEKFFKNLIKISPEDRMSYFYYGMCKLKEGDFITSLKFILKAYNMGFKTPGLYKALGYNLYKLRRLYEAIVYLEEGVKRYPEDESLKKILKYYNSVSE